MNPADMPRLWTVLFAGKSAIKRRPVRAFAFCRHIITPMKNAMKRVLAVGGSEEYTGAFFMR